MGLEWERLERRRVLDRKIQQAFLDAIGDADSEYDDNDAEVLRDAYDAYLDSPDFPDAVSGKELVRG